jgi:hypothetical protein
MLTIDIHRRPTINQVLRMPFLAVRIKKFLQQDTFKDEFSHTILHRKQVQLGNPESLSKPIMASKPPSPISAAPPLSNRYNVAAGAGSKQVTVAPVNRYQIGGCGPGEQAKK